MEPEISFVVKAFILEATAPVTSSETAKA